MALAALCDAVCVLVFAAAGRSQHDEAVSVAGVWETAWPFLLALLTAWLVALVWRRPFSVLRSGLPVWLVTLVLGMLVRVWFTDDGAPLAFVLVAAGTLGFAFLGWRLVVWLVRTVRSRRRGSAILVSTKGSPTEEVTCP